MLPGACASSCVGLFRYAGSRGDTEKPLPCGRRDPPTGGRNLCGMRRIKTGSSAGRGFFCGKREEAGKAFVPCLVEYGLFFGRMPFGRKNMFLLVCRGRLSVRGSVLSVFRRSVFRVPGVPVRGSPYPGGRSLVADGVEGPCRVLLSVVSQGAGSFRSDRVCLPQAWRFLRKRRTDTAGRRRLPGRRAAVRVGKGGK